MKNVRIEGVFEFEDKEYPFVLIDKVVSIPQAAFQYSKDFPNETHVDVIHGVTSNNKDIYFLDCKLWTDLSLSALGKLRLHIMGYAIMRSDKKAFDRVDFYASAINAFYSPKSAYANKTDDNMWINGITQRDPAEYTKHFSCAIDGENIDGDLGVYINWDLAAQKEQIGTVNTIFSLQYEQKKELIDVLKYYLYVRDFFEFLNFQRNVPMSDIRVFEKNADGKYANIGNVVVFQTGGSDYKPNPHHSITFQDCGEKCLPVLFSQIAERRIRNKRNPFFFPENRFEDRYVDSAKWLITAVAFEGEFDEIHPNYRAEHNDDFKNVKELLLGVIEDNVKKSGKGWNNPINDNWKRFRHLIKNNDTKIEEKFQACLEIYKTETAGVIGKICKQEAVHDGVNLANAYASYRNQTAHGGIQPLTPADIAVYRILRCFVYAMNLRKAGVPADNVKSILNKMF